MRQTIELRILSLYAGGAENSAYNISEIARKTGAAYPHAYNAVAELIKEDLLLEKTYGNARYCMLNLANPLARNLLAQVMLRQKNLVASHSLKNLEREVQRIGASHPELIGALFHDGSTSFIVAGRGAEKKIRKGTFLFNIIFYTPKTFIEELLKSEKLLSATIIFGHERVLFLISQVQKQLIFKKRLEKFNESEEKDSATQEIRGKRFLGAVKKGTTRGRRVRKGTSGGVRR